MNLLRGVASGFGVCAGALILSVPLFLVGLVSLASRGRTRRSLARWMEAIVQTWVAGNRLTFKVLGVTRIHTRFEHDRGLSPERWYLVLSNHQSWSDILILQNALWSRIPLLKFFSKRQLVWVPVAGQAMWFLGFPLVRRLSRERIAADPSLAELDRQATLDACGRFRDHPTAVLSFLEGTRFTAAKHQAQEARFDHLLNPKLGGVSYVVDALKDRIHKVLDVTIVYRGGVPSFWELLSGRCHDVDVLVQCHDLPAAVVGASDADDVRERLRPWIEALWQDKDARLAGAAEPVC